MGRSLTMRYQFVTKKKESKKLSRFLSIENLLKGPTPDMGLILCVFGLVVFGWVMVYSSSALFAEQRYQDQFFFLKKQMMWSCIGVGGFLLAANIPFSFWQKNVRWLYAGIIALLVLVLIIGPKISGAQRWIHLPGI